MPITTDAAVLAARFDELGVLAVSGAAAGTVAAAEVVQGVVGHKLTEMSHAKGTPTPSRPGQPPAKIEGDLAGSFIPHPGLGFHGLETELRSELPYAAIHEFGGRAGRGGATELPERPYLRPAIEESTGLIEAAFVSSWLL